MKNICPQTLPTAKMEKESTAGYNIGVHFGSIRQDFHAIRTIDDQHSVNPNKPGVVQTTPCGTVYIYIAIDNQGNFEQLSLNRGKHRIDQYKFTIQCTFVHSILDALICS
jgi:hypothetical protein